MAALPETKAANVSPLNGKHSKNRIKLWNGTSIAREHFENILKRGQ